MKTKKTAYWLSIVWFRGFFDNIGYPTYLIYPMVVAKILGLAAVWDNFGFCFDFLISSEKV